MDNNQNNFEQNGYQPPVEPQYEQPQYQPPQYQQPVYQQPIYTQPVHDDSKGLAITSLVLSILSIFCCGVPFSIAGFICGIISKTRKSENNGMATAGIIISVIGFVLAIFAIAIFFIGGTYTSLLEEIYYY